MHLLLFPFILDILSKMSVLPIQNTFIAKKKNFFFRCLPIYYDVFDHFLNPFSDDYLHACYPILPSFLHLASTYEYLFLPGTFRVADGMAVKKQTKRLCSQDMF